MISNQTNVASDTDLEYNNYKELVFRITSSKDMDELVVQLNNYIKDKYTMISFEDLLTTNDNSHMVRIIMAKDNGKL